MDPPDIVSQQRYNLDGGHSARLGLLYMLFPMTIAPFWCMRYPGSVSPTIDGLSKYPSSDRAEERKSDEKAMGAED
jgi:hypothetical protein